VGWKSSEGEGILGKRTGRSEIRRRPEQEVPKVCKYFFEHYAIKVGKTGASAILPLFVAFKNDKRITP